MDELTNREAIDLCILMLYAVRDQSTVLNQYGAWSNLTCPKSAVLEIDSEVEDDGELLERVSAIAQLVADKLLTEPLLNEVLANSPVASN
jgi:hypothetical protein